MVTRKKIAKRKTTKKRYYGGIQEECPVCHWKYHIHGSVGAPTGKLLNRPNYQKDAFFEDHFLTHPLCQYCNTKHLDTKTLAQHIKDNHSDKYNIALKIKTDLLDNNKSIMDDLIAENWRIIGTIPTLDNFYNKIAEKENQITNDKIKKDKLATEKQQATQKKPINIKVISEPIIVEDDNKKRIAEEQRIKREEAIARKVAEEKRKAIEEEEERLRAKALKIEADRKKKAAKKAAKNATVIDADVVDNIISAIENTSVETASIPAETTPVPVETTPVPVETTHVPVETASIPAEKTPVPVETTHVPVETTHVPVETTHVPVILKHILNMRKLSDKSTLLYKLKSSRFQLDIHNYILSEFPMLNCNTNTIIDHNYYESVTLIVFLVGLLNMFFKANNIDIKMIIKGGRAAQIILSKYGFRKCQINTDDIDILLVQNNSYNREFLNSIAKQFANLIKELLQNSMAISILEPRHDSVNPNIYKISYKPENSGFKPISDIDFKQNDSEFFRSNSLMEIPLQTRYYNDNFILLYYVQTPKAFVEEKLHYLSIYENMHQATQDGKKTCDCSIVTRDYDCDMTCKYRELMVEKFKRYIEPFTPFIANSAY